MKPEPLYSILCHTATGFSGYAIGSNHYEVLFISGFLLLIASILPKKK